MVGRLCKVVDWLVDPINLTAISTLAIAAFTIVLAVVGYVQARLIRKSIALAREEFLSTHRPKIILREAYTLELLEGEEVRVFLHFANVGETKGTIISSEVLTQTISSDRVMLSAPLDENINDTFGRISLKPPEQVATRAMIELVLLFRTLDDHEDIDDGSLGDEFGDLYLKDFRVVPLSIREVANKTIHAKTLEWIFDDTKKPILKVTAHNDAREKWSHAEIDINTFAVGCAMLAG